MKSKWITYKGVKIMLTDYSDFKNDTQALQMENDAADAVICQQLEGSVLCLVDIRETVGSSDAVAIMKNSAKRTKPYIRKMAVVGVTGVKRILADAVIRFSGRDLLMFDDLQSAQEWLVKD